MITDAFEEVMREGPLAKEPGVKIKVNITDCKLHEDAIHRGPAQVLPAVRDAIREAMIDAGAVIFEPVQVLQIEAPADCMANVSKIVQNKRGQLLEIQQEEQHMIIKAKIPVAELFGFTSELRSATSGRGCHFVIDQMFERVPREIQEKVVKQIRERKGLKVESVPKSS